MAYEASGTIKLINDTQTFPSGFSKREFVITTEHDKYPQDLKFEVVKDRCDMLDQFSVGQKVNLQFDIRGNEYKDRYYVNLSCWKMEAAEGGDAPSASASDSSDEPSAAELRKEDDFDDDIPF
ncbi:MAG: DUF3127 domain-containing protein [Akkermansiaceae bacterium]|nr:DUF3127 domain-containing protein [Akkermansiaceae bacterium]